MKGKPMRFQTTKNMTCRFAIATLILSLGACSHAPKEAPPQPAVIDDHGLLRIPEHSPLRTRLQVQTVELRALPHTLAAPAMVEADPARTANILPSLSGKVVSLKVGLGDTVHRGQLLAVIGSGDFAQAVADVAKARDALDLAKKSLDRASGVQQAGGAAVKDLQAAQSGYNQALDEYQRAQTRLTAVVDVTLAAWPGQALHGRVARVSPLLEPDTRRVKVRIAFDNADGRLKPNMFATATFAVPQPAPSPCRRRRC
jgi:cobalt-zinc-cadmium efflux system membrane fusion protein